MKSITEYINESASYQPVAVFMESNDKVPSQLADILAKNLPIDNISKDDIEENDGEFTLTNIPSDKKVAQDIFGKRTSVDAMMHTDESSSHLRMEFGPSWVYYLQMNLDKDAFISIDMDAKTKDEFIKKLK